MKRAMIGVAVVALLIAACSSAEPASTTTTTTSLAAASESTTTTTKAPATTTTVAPTTTTTEAPAGIPTTPVVPGEDADADAIVDLYAVVFDTGTSVDEKMALIDGSDGLETAIEGYNAAGQAVGGIFLAVTETGVDGATAAVIYDLLFAGAPFQTDQVGEAISVEGSWLVTRDYFCSIVELARVPCS